MGIARVIAGMILALMGIALVVIAIIAFNNKNDNPPTPLKSDQEQIDSKDSPSKAVIGAVKGDCQDVEGLKKNKSTVLCTISLGPLNCTVGTTRYENAFRAVSCYSFRDASPKEMEFRGCVERKEEDLYKDTVCVTDQGSGSASAVCMSILPKRSRVAEVALEQQSPQLAISCLSLIASSPPV